MIAARLDEEILSEEPVQGLMPVIILLSMICLEQQNNWNLGHL